MDKTLFYLCFPLSDNEDDAARRFVEKFGKPPEVIEEFKRLLWVGPVPASPRTSEAGLGPRLAALGQEIGESVRAGVGETGLIRDTGIEGEGTRKAQNDADGHE